MVLGNRVESAIRHLHAGVLMVNDYGILILFHHSLIKGHLQVDYLVPELSIMKCRIQPQGREGITVLVVIQLGLHNPIDVVQMGADLLSVVLLLNGPPASKLLRSDRLDLSVHLLSSQQLKLSLLDFLLLLTSLVTIKSQNSRNFKSKFLKSILIQIFIG